MYSQLLAVIMMACGVASGTKAPSNTFYDENTKPQVKKAIETINDVIDIKDTGQVNNYLVINPNSTEDRHTLRKYYIDSTTDPNKYLTYMNIYNTIYSDYKVHDWRPSINWQQVECVTYCLFTVNNYYDSVLRYKIQVEDTVSATTNGYEYQDVYITDENLDNYINMNLTQTTRDTLDNYINSISNDNVFSYGNGVTTPSSGEYTTETQTPYITLQPRQQAHILMKIRIQYDRNANVTALSNTPTKFKITGELLIPDNNQEIVDIPGLMYTVLTMPFSFISTAFNLTVFPGTPYALNFGNLFLTILAVFILLWLIKKVFH